MPRYQLSRDVTLTFQRIHTVRAKAGTPLQTIYGGSGVVCYAIAPHNVETDSERGPNSIFQHDTRHYYIWVPTDAVEEVPEAGQ